MTTTRRDFIKKTAAVAASIMMSPLPVWARNSLSLGELQIDTLHDGHLVLPGDFILGPMPQEELLPILQRYHLSRKSLSPECNMTLIRDGERTILFDVGSGSGFQPTAGKGLEALEALDLEPDDVTHVVFTHAHPDHLWGLLDDFDDPMFPNATHMIGKTEWDYWMDPNTVNTIDASRTAFAVGAQRRLEVIEDAITFFKDDEEILPGIASRATFGHTPGHMSFEVRSGTDSVMIVGDAIGNHHVAFERPQWQSGSDQDMEIAAKARTMLLDRIATEKMQLIGFHLPNGGLGRAEKTSDGYRFIEEDAS
ncbi:MBL fold metallo-hydrolase [Cohaesibacter celericrescens]|uniref:MBL fold metallo-hydrolase n=1 Tax=Cohaesibacter celericrescens TaxID=2067669 RepID=A0A2N5XTS2_9HYPH|nr:MBL fold metallo-hydrolase [Cohaesibacter celericrescens]PLW77845.1 MBL fold metallo-hydrolase [Cohaesibacter celericrescens]